MMIILEETETGWEVYRNTLYYRHNFPVNLKFFQNQKFILKKLLLIHWGVLSLTYQLAKIKKFKSNLLTRIWGNKLSHTLLVDIQTGITLKEGNLITSVRKRYNRTLMKFFIFKIIHWSTICNNKRQETIQVSFHRKMDNKLAHPKHKGLLMQQ